MTAALRSHWRSALALFFLFVVAAIVEGLSFWSVLPLLRTVMPAAGEASSAAVSSTGSSSVFSAVFQRLDGIPRSWILLGVVGLFALGAALSLARSWYSERFQWRLRQDWVLRIMRNFLEMPYLAFRSRRLGGLMETLGTETKMGSQCIWELAEGSSRLVFFLVLSLVFLLTAWQAALVVAAFAIVLALVARPSLYRRSAELGQKQIFLNQSWKGLATESLLGFREIKLLGKEREATEALRPDLAALARTASLRRLLGAAPNALSTLAFVLLTLGLIAAQQAFSGTDWTAWVPVLGFALVLSRRLMILAAAVVSHFASFRGHLPSLAFVREHLAWDEGDEEAGATDRDLDSEDAGPDERAWRNRIPLQASGGPEVRFEGVEFAYPNKEPVLRDVCFSLPGGRITVLQGRSGVGKSTVADLLLRLIRPQAGTIHIGGESLQELDPKAWRKAIGYVSQESFFFNATVRENLLAARGDATDADLWEACRVAGAEDFLHRLPAGLDTLLGERGPELSGGERQRLAIARAVLRKPPLLVLDEVTSAVDPETAEGIWRRLSALGSATTVLVLSHALPPGLRTDQVLGIEGGRVSLVPVVEGAFTELA